MKKSSFYTILFSALCTIVNAQSRHDYIWPIGYGATKLLSSGYMRSGILMDFNQDTEPVFSLDSFVTSGPQAAICDTSGLLVAYTDGCHVYNRDHQIMLGGDSLNPGDVFREFCTIRLSYAVWQGNLFLPSPAHSDQYYLFHLRKDDYLWNAMDILYSVVDATGDNGKGEVIDKNKAALSDSIWLGSYITATRHANGRDWWIVAPQRFKNGYHVCLLSPEGVQYKGLQNIGDTSIEVYGGQIAFSPDGSKFFKHWPEGVQILDFDRCTGQFSKPYYLYLPVVDYGGVAVSPSGQYLYLSTQIYVYQYDLWASDLSGSRQTVATYDGFRSPFDATFFQMQLAPNGKIYMSSNSSNNLLHVINQPDLPGLACDMVQHGIILPALTNYVFINVPHYRLGALAGSPCDSTTSAVHHPTLAPDGIDFYPNPASDEVVFEKLTEQTASAARVRLFSLTGAFLCEQDFPAGAMTTRLRVRHLPAGTYFWEIRWEDGRRTAGRLQKG